MAFFKKTVQPAIFMNEPLYNSISLWLTDAISTPQLRLILCLAPSSPSSPAALVAGVLCHHRPTQERSCDPVRSPCPEHGASQSAPAVTGSRTPDQPCPAARSAAAAQKTATIR